MRTAISIGWAKSAIGRSAGNFGGGITFRSGMRRRRSEADLKKAFAGRDDVVWQRDPSTTGWLICRCEEDLAEDAVPGRKLGARRRRARYLVQLGPVAAFDAGLAR